MPQEENQSPPNDTLGITDLDTFVRALLHWHTNKVELLQHMKTIPDGTEVTIEGSEPKMLQGDMLAGFQLGLSLALSELGTLPFAIEVDEEPTAAPAGN